MGDEDIAGIKAQLAGLDRRMSTLEASRVADIAGVRSTVVSILAEEMPKLIREGVRSVINEERLVADAQRFRSIINIGRKVGIAVVIALSTTVAIMVLNSWLAS